MEDEALFTDLYELTMLQAYFNEGMEDEAVFGLFIRRLPPNRNFLVACGLEQALTYLERLQFTPASLQYLDSLDIFSAPFLDYLARLRFTGDVRAVPEGTIVFPGEPLLEVSAPLPQAQLVETYLLNQLTFGTMIASKGVRALLAAEGRALVDFGSRRAHGTDAGLKAARALYLAGYDSTSNVLAGRLFGIPVAGTMAHSYIQAHESEDEAFQAFVSSFPDTVLLVDTYDTEEGVRRAINVIKLADDVRVRAIRLDSGDLVELSKRARRLLDEAGLGTIRIFASGGLDEYEISQALAAGALIDAFGVGTAAVVSSDGPALDSVYKLVSYAGRPRLKLSPDKITLPGKKQVFRLYENGRMAGDVMSLVEERHDGKPLLVEVMRDGRRTDAGNSTLSDARERTRLQVQALPEPLRGLGPAAQAYPITVSAGIEQQLQELSAALSQDVSRRA